MKNIDNTSRDPRAAISALFTVPKIGRPFAISGLFGAVRRVFPNLGASDAGSEYSAAIEPSTARFDFNSDDASTPMEIEIPDGEGAAVKSPRTEAQRRSDNDTNGTRRRARETHTRHQLI